jgi:DNA-binding response OmpR family regulator
MSTVHILLIEDDVSISEIIIDLLQSQHYRVSSAVDGIEGLDKARTLLPDLVILDVVLPKMDGLAVCRNLRQDPKLVDIPVLFLSGKVFDEDKIAGFRAGADDYLCKPFNIDELSLRINALLRRAKKRAVYLQGAKDNYQRTVTSMDARSGNSPQNKRELVVADFTLDERSYEIHTPTHGKFRLTPVQFNLLHYLMSHPGRIFSTSFLLNAVWGYPMGTGSPDLVRVHIKSLRQRIERDPSNPQFIRTVPGFGYIIHDGKEPAADE